MVHAPLESLRAGVAFAHGLTRHGERPALRDRTAVVTYDDLAHRVAEAAADLGVEPQLIHLAPAPTVDFVVAYLAALSAGHPVLLTDREPLAAAYGASVVRTEGTWRPTGVAAPEVHPDLQLLLSTSGSTGSPKLVRLSAANLDANADAIADYLQLTADDVAITTLPLDYCYGLSVLHSHLAVGASVVLTDRSVTDAELWCSARQHGVTTIAGVPYTFELLEAAGWPDFPTLRRVTQAGGRLAPEKVSDLARKARRDGWDLFVMYGQTEATARMAYLPPELALEHPAAIGVPIPGGSLRVDQPDAAGVGELVYSGPNVMMGYAESTADLARGPEVTELHTGDLARVNEAGLFEITGRASRFAKLFGQRIDLDRVETLLTAEGYDACCAESPDGRLVLALVGAADEITVDLATAAAIDATGLPRHAIRPTVVTEVPRRSNGKPDHAAIARLASTNSTAEDRPTRADPLEATLAQFATVLDREVTPEDTFTSLGGDSLSYVELAVRLEARLTKLPRDWPTRTVRDLAGLHHSGRQPRWQWLDTTIVLRALAIILIVGSHSNVFSMAGGAHILLAVAGFNLARFVLADERPRHRTRGLLRAAARIAVPASIWITAVWVIAGDYGWRNALLLNDALGPRSWAEPEFYFWFVEVLVYLVAAVAVVTSVPWLTRLERRAPYGFAIGLLVLALVPRYWASATGYDGDIIHSSLFVAWLFVGGWAAAQADTTAQRTLVSVVLLVATYGWFDDPKRELIVAAGVLALIWLPAVPWPRLVSGATGVVASASLYVYLTHWQVYPHLKYDWPLGGLLASLAVGIAVWYAVDRLPAKVRRWRSGATAEAAVPRVPA